MGTGGGGRCAGLQRPPWPFVLTDTLPSSFAVDLPLLLYPGLFELSLCLGHRGASSGAGWWPHRHSLVLVIWLSWQLLREKVKAGASQKSLLWFQRAGGSPWDRVGSAPSPSTAM